MPEKIQHRAVKRVRAEFETSDSLRDAMNQFLISPRMYLPAHTTAERIVLHAPSAEQQFEQARKAAKERLKLPIARRALTLVAPVIQVTSVALQFKFDSPDKDVLDAVTDVLDEFPTLGETVQRTGIVIELARASLKEPTHLDHARRNLTAVMNNSETAKNMKVYGIHIVAPIIPNFPIRDDWDLPVQ